MHLSYIPAFHVYLWISWSPGQVITTCTCPAYEQFILSWTFPDVQSSPSILHLSCIQTDHIDLNFSVLQAYTHVHLLMFRTVHPPWIFPVSREATWPLFFLKQRTGDYYLNLSCMWTFHTFMHISWCSGQSIHPESILYSDRWSLPALVLSVDTSYSLIHLSCSSQSNYHAFILYPERSHWPKLFLRHRQMMLLAHVLCMYISGSKNVCWCSFWPVHPPLNLSCNPGGLIDAL